MVTSLLGKGDSYKAVYDNFKWNIPQKYNIAHDVCDRWAEDKDRVALIYENETKNQKIFYFSDVQKYANQLANLFVNAGRQELYLAPVLSFLQRTQLNIV